MIAKNIIMSLHYLIKIYVSIPKYLSGFIKYNDLSYTDYRYKLNYKGVSGDEDLNSILVFQQYPQYFKIAQLKSGAWIYLNDSQKNEDNPYSGSSYKF